MFRGRLASECLFNHRRRRLRGEIPKAGSLTICQAFSRYLSFFLFFAIQSKSALNEQKLGLRQHVHIQYICLFMCRYIKAALWAKCPRCADFPSSCLPLLHPTSPSVLQPFTSIQHIFQLHSHLLVLSFSEDIFNHLHLPDPISCAGCYCASLI